MKEQLGGHLAAGQGQPTTVGDREGVPLGGLVMDACGCHSLRKEKLWQEVGTGVGQQGGALAPRHGPCCVAWKSTSTKVAVCTSG